MKRFFVLGLSLLLCLLCFAACGSADDFVPAGYRLISADGASYRLYVPEDWVEDLSTGVTTAYVSESDRSNISLMAFELDDSLLHVEIGGTEAVSEEATTAEDGTVPKITTAEQYWKYYEAEFLKTFSDMTYVTEGDDLLLSGQKAKKYVYTATVTGQSYEFLQVVALKDGVVYIFTYTATEAKFESHLEDVNEILGYIELK